MKISNIIYILFLSVAVLLSGCDEEFFVTPPLAADSEASYYNNFENIETAVVGCYSMLNAQGFIDHGKIMITGSIAADDMEGGGKGPNDTPAIQEIDRLTHTSENSYIPSIWGYGYKGVYFCNMFLKYFPAFDDGSLSDGKKALLDIRTGEVYFLRAMYNFVLTQIFGGIVILEEPVLLSELESLKRATVKEMLAFIESDLRTAMDLLPLKKDIDDVGRANREAARALLAKTLLYESSYAKYKAGDERFGDVQQRWAEALGYAEQVIDNSSGISLPGLNGETFNTFWGESTDAYRYIFSVDGDNNSGSIFEVQNVCVNDAYGWIQARGNSLTKWTSFREFTDETGKVQNWGWGWMAPSQRLRDIFEDGDPRIKTIFGTTEDSALVILNNVEYWTKLMTSWSSTGYNLRKYESSPEQYWTPSGGEWNRGPINDRLIRLADVYLMAAEAAFESNQTGKALDYVNTVRRRADMCDGSEDGIPSQLASVTINDIRDERRRELAGEGDRYFDIVRWNIADEIMSGMKIQEGTITIDWIPQKHDFFPIPQSEIGVLNGAIEQYEGW